MTSKKPSSDHGLSGEERQSFLLRTIGLPPGQFPIPTISSAFFLGQRGGRAAATAAYYKLANQVIKEVLMFLSQHIVAGHKFQSTNTFLIT